MNQYDGLWLEYRDKYTFDWAMAPRAAWRFRSERVVEHYPHEIILLVAGYILMPGRKFVFLSRTETYRYVPELEEEFDTDQFEEPSWAEKAVLAVRDATNKDLYKAHKNRKFGWSNKRAFLTGPNRREFGHVSVWEAGVCECEPWDLPWPILSTDEPRRTPIVLESLMGIARPAKVKGVAKDYEVVALPPKVIVLEEVEESIESLELDDSDWEEVEGPGMDADNASKETYASVAKG